MTIYSDIKEAIKLLDSVKSLQENTKELATIVNEIDKRLIRVEERFDGLEERLLTSASSAASVAAMKSHQSTHERIIEIEHRLKQAESLNNHLPKE